MLPHAFPFVRFITRMLIAGYTEKPRLSIAVKADKPVHHLCELPDRKLQNIL